MAGWFKGRRDKPLPPMPDLTNLDKLSEADKRQLAPIGVFGTTSLRRAVQSGLAVQEIAASSAVTEYWVELVGMLLHLTRWRLRRTSLADDLTWGIFCRLAELTLLDSAQDPLNADPEAFESKLQVLAIVVALDSQLASDLAGAAQGSESEYRSALAKNFAERLSGRGVAGFRTVWDSASRALGEIDFGWFVVALESRGVGAIQMDVSSRSRVGALLSRELMATLLEQSNRLAASRTGKGSGVDPEKCPYCGWKLTELELERDACDHLRAFWQPVEPEEGRGGSDILVDFIYPSLTDRPRWLNSDGSKVSATVGIRASVTDLYQHCRELAIRLFEHSSLAGDDPPTKLATVRNSVLAGLDPVKEDNPNEAATEWWPLVEDQLRLMPSGRGMSEYLFRLWTRLETGAVTTSGDRTIIWSDPLDELRFLASLRIDRDQVATAIRNFEAVRGRRRFQIYLHNHGDKETPDYGFYDNRLDGQTVIARKHRSEEPRLWRYVLHEV